jgi:hypothetical protein
MNDELQRVWKKNIKVLFQHSLGGIEENQIICNGICQEAEAK